MVKSCRRTDGRTDGQTDGQEPYADQDGPHNKIPLPLRLLCSEPRSARHPIHLKVNTTASHTVNVAYNVCLCCCCCGNIIDVLVTFYHPSCRVGSKCRCFFIPLSSGRYFCPQLVLLHAKPEFH